MDPFQVLGVARNASKEEVKRAYRKLAKQHHPDRNPGDKEAEATFKRVQEAYDLIMDGPPRHAQTPFTSPFTSPWDQFFGNKARNYQVRLDVDLKEVLETVVKEITIPHRGACVTCGGFGYSEVETCGSCKGQGRISLHQGAFNLTITCTACGGAGKHGKTPCNDCNGSGLAPGRDKKIKITIPAGTETGMQVRVPAEGEANVHGGRNGDLIVTVYVRPHPVFTRVGADLLVVTPVSYAECVLGSKLEVPTLQGETVVVELPPGIRPDQKICVRGKGLPHFGSGSPGNLIVALQLDLPDSTTEEHRAVLQKLLQLERDAVTIKRSELKSKCN